MNFKIHRGTIEIGGSCVEVWTQTTRIIVDFGMPLVNSDKTQFDSKKISKIPFQSLIEKGILPNIQYYLINCVSFNQGVKKSGLFNPLIAFFIYIWNTYILRLLHYETR